MSEGYDNSVEPSPLCMIEVQFEPGQEWQRFPTEGVNMEDVHRWRYPRPAMPTTPAEPCNDCAHRDVPPWVKPCVDCLTDGKHVNFREPVVADSGEHDPKFKRPSPTDRVEVQTRPNGPWFDIAAASVHWGGVHRWRFAVIPAPTTPAAPTGGGKLTGSHYYRVTVADPMAPDVPAYTAECADIIEALGMTFNEGECFKALWRLAAHRQGRVKSSGAGPQYDADKVAHYGARVAAQTKRDAS